MKMALFEMVYHLLKIIHRGREVPMPSYEEVTQRARSLRSVTGVTDKAFQALLPHFEQAFEAYMGNRTIDGQPRTSRRYTTYASGAGGLYLPAR
jgi:hypothetical protein